MKRSALLATCGLLAMVAGAANPPDEPLDPEKAFRLTAALAPDGAGLNLRYNILDGYYLYRNRFRVEVWRRDWSSSPPPRRQVRTRTIPISARPRSIAVSSRCPWPLRASRGRGATPLPLPPRAARTRASAMPRSRRRWSWSSRQRSVERATSAGARGRACYPGGCGLDGDAFQR